MTTPAKPDLSTANQHADNIRALAKPFRSVIAIADYLDQIGSLETVTNEAQAAADKARADRDAAQLDLVTAHASLAEAQQSIATAQSKADDLTTQATATCAATIAAAQEDAKAILEAAAKAQGGVEQTITGLRAQIPPIEATIAARKADLAAVTAAIAKAKGDIAALGS